jgi:ABC-2 type transport system ATP-binding protein
MMYPTLRRLWVPAVSALDVTRVYKRRRSPDAVTALDGVSLTVDEGEVHGLLGPNGAGKTTLVKIISTVLLPTAGKVEVLGHDVERDPRAVRGLVGVVFGGERGLYTRVSARRNLLFWGSLYGIPRRELARRCADLLDRVGLAERADDPVEGFSRGMKQRLHLARGLLHNPRVLFLDEPTSGMDPVGAHEFRSLIRQLQGEGRSILLATHDMAEAQTLCDRVTLIDRGRILFSEQTSQASRVLGVQQCVDFESTDAALLAALRAQPFVEAVDQRSGGPGQWRALPVSADRLRDVFGWLVARDVLSARSSEPSLEEVYLRLVGERGLVV